MCGGFWKQEKSNIKYNEDARSQFASSIFLMEFSEINEQNRCEHSSVNNANGDSQNVITNGSNYTRRAYSRHLIPSEIAGCKREKSFRNAEYARNAPKTYGGGIGGRGGISGSGGINGNGGILYEKNMLYGGGISSDGSTSRGGGISRSNGGIKFSCEKGNYGGGGIGRKAGGIIGLGGGITLHRNDKSGIGRDVKSNRSK